MGIRKSYLREVTHIGWAEKLEPRILRMLLMSGLGVGLGMFTRLIISAVGAVALNAADYFLIDMLVKGWRPRQFIEGPLKMILLAESRLAPPRAAFTTSDQNLSSRAKAHAFTDVGVMPNSSSFC